MTIKIIGRKPSKQKSVALWEDQEIRIQDISNKIGRPLKLTELVREGIDRVLSELEKDINQK